MFFSFLQFFCTFDNFVKMALLICTSDTCFGTEELYCTVAGRIPVMEVNGHRHS